MKRCKDCGTRLEVGVNTPSPRCHYCDLCAPWRWTPANKLRRQCRAATSVHRLSDGSHAPHVWEERIRQVVQQARARGERFADDLFLDC